MALIEIYGTSTCNWCDRAREACIQYELDHSYKSLDDRFDGESNKAELLERFKGTPRTVPQIYWGGNYIGGYNELITEIENTRNFGQEKI